MTHRLFVFDSILGESLDAATSLYERAMAQQVTPPLRSTKFDRFVAELKNYYPALDERRLQSFRDLLEVPFEIGLGVGWAWFAMPRLSRSELARRGDVDVLISRLAGEFGLAVYDPRRKKLDVLALPSMSVRCLEDDP